jgi:hypothetical protein
MYEATTAALERTQQQVSELRDCLSIAETQYTAATQRILALGTSTSWRATVPFWNLLASMLRPRATRIQTREVMADPIPPKTLRFDEVESCLARSELPAS